MHRLFFAGIAQLVERNLAKVEVASSSLVSRSNSNETKMKCFSYGITRKVASTKASFSFLVFNVRKSGGVAEWSCSGLQSRGRRFNSDPRLQKSLSLIARMVQLVGRSEESELREKGRSPLCH